MNSIEQPTEKVISRSANVSMKIVYRNFSKLQHTISNPNRASNHILNDYWSWSSDELAVHIENLITIKEKIENTYQNNTIHLKRSNFPTRDERFLSQLRRYIEENIDNPELTVNTVILELNISRTHLHRKLKMLLGLSITRYIRKIRLEKAVQLLIQKADNISQIAYQTGFSDCSYFTKCFKQEYGISPSEFSKEKHYILDNCY